MEIQRTYRGWLGRKQFRQAVFSLLWAKRYGFYSRHAEKIQACWRGYYTRKYIHNWEVHRAFQERARQANAKMAAHLETLSQAQEQHRLREAEQREQARLLAEAKRARFMLGTATVGPRPALSLLWVGPCREPGA